MALTASAPDPDPPIDEIVALHAGGASRPEILGRLFDLGLAQVDFDEGFGGLGLDRAWQRQIDGRLAAAGIARPIERNFVGVGMAARLIHEFGTTDQRARHLRPIFTGEHVWCQLFSEPGAGSDLANVSTAAVADGRGAWRVNGQKVWTSFADRAAYGLLLARTDPDEPKHRGLTMFLLDMHAPGITVRPLRMMTGDAEFNEVFLDDVAIPDDARIGGPGDGWKAALAVLMHERAAVGFLGDRSPKARPLDRLLARWPEYGRPDLRDRLVRAWIAAEVIRFTRRRASATTGRGAPAPEAAVLRVAQAEHNAEVLDLALDLEGPDALLMPSGYPSGDRIRSRRGEWDLRREFLFSPGLKIGGGTLEISRTMLAERILGLPPEPVLHKDTPWREAPR